MKINIITADGWMEVEGEPVTIPGYEYLGDLFFTPYLMENGEFTEALIPITHGKSGRRMAYGDTKENALLELKVKLSLHTHGEILE